MRCTNRQRARSRTHAQFTRSAAQRSAGCSHPRILCERLPGLRPYPPSTYLKQYESRGRGSLPALMPILMQQRSTKAAHAHCQVYVHPYRYEYDRSSIYATCTIYTCTHACCIEASSIRARTTATIRALRPAGKLP